METCSLVGIQTEAAMPKARLTVIHQLKCRRLLSAWEDVHDLQNQGPGFVRHPEVKVTGPPSGFPADGDSLKIRLGLAGRSSWL